MASRRKAPVHDEDQDEGSAEDTSTEEGRVKHAQQFHDGNEEMPRFSEEGAPIDKGGNPRPLDPGEFPPDDVERSLWIVGKGGLTARNKLYVEGEAILLSDLEAEQILDRGDKVEHADPVEGKKHAETRAERHAARQQKHAEAHEAAAAEQAQS